MAHADDIGLCVPVWLPGCILICDRNAYHRGLDADLENSRAVLKFCLFSECALEIIMMTPGTDRRIASFPFQPPKGRSGMYKQRLDTNLIGISKLVSAKQTLSVWSKTPGISSCLWMTCASAQKATSRILAFDAQPLQPATSGHPEIMNVCTPQ